MPGNITMADKKRHVTDVLFILFDGIQSLDLTGPLDAFAGANE